MGNRTMKTMIAMMCAAAFLAIGTSANAAVILADAFGTVALDSGAKTATLDSWDTVDGITAPSSVLTFIDGDSTTQLGFFGNNAGTIDVNNNMTAGGWDTTITLAVGSSDIALTTLLVDIKLTNGTGGAQTTSSKSGQVLVEFFDSGSSSVGSADLGGNQNYPTVSYQRTLDVSGITLSANQTYTMVLQARGTGHGHHKALDAIELLGDIETAEIPEPASIAMGLAGLTLIAARRRR